MKSDVGIGASFTAAAMARTLKDRRTAPGKTPPKNKLAAKRIAKKSGQPPPAEVRRIHSRRSKTKGYVKR